MEFSQRRAVLAAFIVAMGGLVFGLDAALISGGIRSFTTEFGLSDGYASAIVSAPGFGVLFALLVSGPLCDRIGRKNTLLFIAALYLASAVLSVLAQSALTLLLARLLGGFAFTSLSIGAMYIGEIAPPHLRGKLVSILQLAIVVGLSAAFFINYAIYAASQSGADWVSAIGMDKSIWRWMLGAEILPAALWFLFLFRIPSSPRWLLAKGRRDDALASIRVLSGNAIAADKPIPENLMVDFGMHEVKETELGFIASYRALFSKPLLMAALVGIIVSITQPITGMNAIFFYSPIVFEQLGSGTESALVQALITGIISVIAVLLSLLTIDRIGRRPMLLAGLGVAAICLLICWYGFSQASYQITGDDILSFAGAFDASALEPIRGVTFDSDVAFKSKLVEIMGFDSARAHEATIMNAAVTLNAGMIFIGILGFIAAYQGTIGPILWVLFSEIFPTRVRGVAITSCAFILSFISWLVQITFLPLLAQWGSANIFLFYGLCIVVCFILNYIFLPETKNKTIEEIEAGFSSAKIGNNRANAQQ